MQTQYPSAAPVADQASTTSRSTSLQPAARAINATKIYGDGDLHVTAVDQVNLDLEAGKFTAIMGPSGSGKSTLMQSMAGLDDLSSGQVFIGDVDLTTLSERKLTRLRRDQVGFVFQAFNLMPTLTALENIRLPLDLAGTKPDQPWLNYVVETVGLTERLDHRPSELSGGQQQRVAVARALAGRPRIIFADEPTGNLDSNAAQLVLSLLRRASHENGQSIAMVTHDPVAASYADRAVFLADGRIAADLPAPTVDAVFQTMRTLEA